MCTLFHANDGTRVLPRREWLKSRARLVTDGTSKTRYRSGWHVLLSRNDAREYLKNFKTRRDRLRIVPCLVKEIRRKKHSPHPVWLAKWLLVL